MLNSPRILYQDFCHYQLAGGRTPIFEYTAPHNRIVLRYDDEALTLLAIRHMVSGEMMPYDGLKRAGAHWNVPVVESLGRIGPGHPSDATAFVAYTRALEDEEGYVVRASSSSSVRRV